MSSTMTCDVEQRVRIVLESFQRSPKLAARCNVSYSRMKPNLFDFSQWTIDGYSCNFVDRINGHRYVHQETEDCWKVRASVTMETDRICSRKCRQKWDDGDRYGRGSFCEMSDGENRWMYLFSRLTSLTKAKQREREGGRKREIRRQMLS